MSLRRRSKRKISVNIQLSKQDLQEYLDDGYTAADIAKDFNVSPAIITEKIRKFGVKKTKQTKAVKNRGRPSLPQKQKRRGRPLKRQSSPRKANPKEEGTSSKQDLDSVITQVIQDNPGKPLDHILSLLKSMGFDFEKSVVKDHLKKLKADPAHSHKKEEKSAREDENGVYSEDDERILEAGQGTLEKKDDKNEISKGTVTDVDGVTITQETENGACTKTFEKMDVEEAEEQDGSDSKEEEKTFQKVGSDGKEKDDADGGISEDEPLKLEPAKKRGRGRPRRVHHKGVLTSEVKEDGAPDKCVDENESLKSEPIRKRRRGRPRKVRVEDEDASTEDSNDENVKEKSELDEEWSEETETRRQGKRRGRKRKSEVYDDEESHRRGRPCIDLSRENLKHCIESGLPRDKIAEVFGTCRRSISRYLQIHRMRKKDRFSNMSDDKLDEMVSEMCRDHPEWGQIQIQEELEKKGLFFRRAQIRNSVRRVDPVGIELRKLNNLKLRWNRGSLKKLDKILPADGINMTSTESFISQPPRTGLNSLNQEDSVRLLKSILTTNEMTYVEHVPRIKVDQQSSDLTGEDVPLVKEEPSDEGEKPVVRDENNEQERQIVKELMEATQMIENTSGGVREEAKEASDQENIGPGSNKQPDLKMEAPQSSASEDEKDLIWKERLYKMVMSNKRAGRKAAAQKRGAAVHIPKEELEECVKLGFSSARIAEKFGTNKRNVRRYLNVYKLGKAWRFEKISDEKIDEIVMEVIQEFAIRKGSEVYNYVKEKGYQIRKADVHKSLSRLFPKGLHRKTSSIVKQSWDASSEPHQSDVSYIVPQEQKEGADADNVGESVVMLNPEDLAQLINGESSIVLVDQHGSLTTGSDGELVVVREEQGPHVPTPISDGLMPTGDTQRPGQDEISAIILEIDFPQNGTSGVSDPTDIQQSDQVVQSAATQHLSQEIVEVDEAQRREHISNVVVLDHVENSSGNGIGSNGHQLVIDHSEVSNLQEENSSAQQEVSLTSLNTVQRNQLDAQVLQELDRIAQNYQATKEDHSVVIPKQMNSGEEKV